jgi:hypothetical protein
MLLQGFRFNKVIIIFAGNILKSQLSQEIATAGQPVSVVGGWSLVVRKKTIR